MRINKFLAEQGIASRRHADAMIEAGRVTVNGKTATLGLCIEENDEIAVDGNIVAHEEKKEEFYIMNINKTNMNKSKHS